MDSKQRIHTQWHTKIPNETVTCGLLKGCVPLEARATVNWKFVVTMNIFPRIKDYKKSVSRDSDMGRLSSVIIEPLWSIVALFLDLQERLSLKAFRRMSAEKRSVNSANTYRRWNRGFDLPIKFRTNATTPHDVKLALDLQNCSRCQAIVTRASFHGILSKRNIRRI